MTDRTPIVLAMMDVSSPVPAAKHWNEVPLIDLSTTVITRPTGLVEAMKGHGRIEKW